MSGLKEISLFLVSVTVATLFGVGCQRAPSKDASKVTIQTPQSSGNQKAGLSALSVPPENRKACYGVNITASDIASTKQECRPALGISSRFVEAGGLLDLEVTRGAARKIDLYLYLFPEGENGSCDTLSLNNSSLNLANTYLIGTSGSISIQKDVETIAIDASFPGTASHLVQQLGLPATCLPETTPAPSPSPVPTPPPSSTPTSSYHPAPLFSVSTAQGVASGGNIKIIGRVGRPVEQGTATGSGYRLRQRDNK